jgi:hypothetical protein
LILSSKLCLKNAAPLIRIPPGLASRKRRLRGKRSLSQPTPSVSALAGHTQDGGIVGRAPIGVRWVFLITTSRIFRASSTGVLLELMIEADSMKHPHTGKCLNVRHSRIAYIR